MALNQLVPISLIVMVLLVLVITSYRQTIFAYPRWWRLLCRLEGEPRRDPVTRRGRIAAGRLHLDRGRVGVGRRRRHHVGVPGSCDPERVEICLGFIVIMTIANLRGMKESGRLFAGPTYVYIVALAP